MTDLKIRNILISDLKLFLIKGALWREFEAGFLYKGVSYTRGVAGTYCSVNHEVREMNLAAICLVKETFLFDY